MTDQIDSHRVVKARRSTFSILTRTLRTAPFSAKLGMAVICIYAFCALFAPLIAPYGESEVISKKAYEISNAHALLGTDQIGRDIFSRLIYGARNTIGIALVTTLLSFVIGGTLGIFAALNRGFLDQLASRIVDVFLSIPVLIFALMLLAVAGKSVINLILILALLDSTRVFRLARASALNVVVMDYVEAARLRGESLRWIIFREVVPNILTPMITEFGLRFCFVFLTISALSFLGVGVQPPTADWGSMVAENKSLIISGRATPLYPAAAIAILTVAVNFVVDWVLHRTSGLRDG